MYLIAEQAVISEQGGFFQEIVKQAGHNKRAGWSVSKKSISEQAEFYTKKNVFNAFYSEKTHLKPYSLTKLRLM